MKKCYKKNRKKSFTNYCSNCNINGHSYKQCVNAITSFGVICVKIESLDNTIKNDICLFLEQHSKFKFDNTSVTNITVSDMMNFCKFKDSIKFLMIRRKYTLGYIEFIRGRYEVENIEGIIFLFKQMVAEEIENIANSTFDQLWNGLWIDNKKPYYQTEYTESKKKFESLQEFTEDTLPIDFYTSNVKPNWKTAEWGFPKGRRNCMEEDIECAVREFGEETSFLVSDHNMLNVFPFVEEFTGTNGLEYKHVYYMSVSTSDKVPQIDDSNNAQCSEIGDIGWFTYEEAINMIRPYHIERKRILANIFISIINIILKLRV